MPAQWTGRLIGEFHNAGVTITDIANEAGLNRSYVSQVLNSEMERPKTEAKLRAALERLKEAKANAKEES